MREKSSLSDSRAIVLRSGGNHNSSQPNHLTFNVDNLANTQHWETKIQELPSLKPSAESS